MTSTRTTVRASSFSARRCAVVAPTLPAPTTVILESMVRGKLTRVGQVTKGVKERLEALRDVLGAARQEIALQRRERSLAERGLGAVGERRQRVACRKRPAGGGVLRGVLEDVRQGLACSLTGTCRSQTRSEERRVGK